jgi:hypothetical protein
MYYLLLITFYLGTSTLPPSKHLLPAHPAAPAVNLHFPFH